MSPIPNLRTSKKLGFIVPSSNTVVEPTCNAILDSLNTHNPNAPPLIALYTRIKVTTVGTDTTSTAQFSPDTLVAAAQLLADAECDAILWNGTSGMWVGAGLAADEALARALQTATGGVPCSTTTLATVAALREARCRTLALATPYTAALTGQLVDFFARDCGVRVVRAERLGETPGSNLEIARCPPEAVEEVVRRACGGSGGGEVPDAVVVACTNWPGAGRVQGLEDEGSVRAKVIDSVTVTVWMALRMVGYDGGVGGWGSLLRDVGRG